MRLPSLKTSLSTLLPTATLAFLALSPMHASADVMLGASLPNDGFSRDVISDFNSVVPKNLAYVNVFSSFSHGWDNLYWQSSNVVAEGAMPMITWMPVDLQRKSDNLLPEIALGMWDDYLMQWGDKLMAWVNMYPESEQPRLAIRFAHEFNGNWYPYSNTPQSYKAAWTHIHDIFNDIGVNEHVDWVWSASRTNVDDYNDFTQYYPGDSYVDWTSLDGYNWGSNYSAGNWSTFTDIFQEPYSVLVQNYPEKPIMIAETGTAEPSDLPNTDYGMYGDNADALQSKSVWTTDMLTQLEESFPAIRALTVFNINKELNWSMTAEYNSGLDSWIAESQSSYFTSEFLVASISKEESAVVDKSESKTKGKSQSRGNAKKGVSSDSTTLALTSLTSLYPTASISAKNHNGTTQPIRNIKMMEQTALAKSKKFAKTFSNKNKQLAKVLKSFSKSKREKFVTQKMSVIDY